MASARFFPAINPLNSYSEYATDLGEWWSELDESWQDDRSELVRILMEADKLKGIVRIMGEEGLSEKQRKILLAEKLIMEGFLQQSSFIAKDKYSSPEKQAALLKLIISTVHVMLADETPAVQLTEKLRLDALIRLKNEVASDEVEKISQWKAEQ